MSYLARPEVRVALNKAAETFSDICECELSAAATDGAKRLISHVRETLESRFARHFAFVPEAHYSACFAYVLTRSEAISRERDMLSLKRI